MRLAWLTDIHLNLLPRHRMDGFASAIRAAQPDAVVLSGDIGEAPSVGFYLRFLENRLGVPIYFVLGNHDYYHSSVQAVTDSVEALCRSSNGLHWLNSQAAPVELAPGVALIGHDGWSDGRLGDYARSPVLLEDYRYIEDLLDPATRLERLHALGDRAVAHLRPLLAAALEQYREVIVVTHPPPFREACWYEGKTAAPDDPYLPHFTCKAVGDLLLEQMTQHPDGQLTVLCGHTHGAGEVRLLPNLHVIAGGAEYGKPAVQRVLVW